MFPLNHSACIFVQPQDAPAARQLCCGSAQCVQQARGILGQRKSDFFFPQPLWGFSPLLRGWDLLIWGFLNRSFQQFAVQWQEWFAGGLAYSETHTNFWFLNSALQTKYSKVQRRKWFIPVYHSYTLEVWWPFQLSGGSYGSFWKQPMEIAWEGNLVDICGAILIELETTCPKRTGSERAGGCDTPTGQWISNLWQKALTSHSEHPWVRDSQLFFRGAVIDHQSCNYFNWRKLPAWHLSALHQPQPVRSSGVWLQGCLL